ncbi:putative hepatocyte growth factor-like [Trypanosoma theileri]|uniref:Putative hepatocyte growth factor-like n=1 Tax=Trypanosoma theileri TaxID=67003 RepID=A0A1X0P4R7_9TRYP|nr:putative hepatocyte growth factor-like [Trypanosoma theileri]ORC91828.1 putative hepatocyte growth factor-like [Trypanosoma theileri]
MPSFLSSFLPLLFAAFLVSSSRADITTSAVLDGQGSSSSSNNNSCDPVEGYYLPNGEDYRGHLNITESGIPCQKWSEQYPHPHDTTVPDPLTGVGDHNYCRNPSRLERPGCFTTDPYVRYQFCSLEPPCNFTPSESVLQFEPKSGTHLGVNEPITITCFPRPCKVYYTLDGKEPTTISATLYTRPFVLEKNTTVRALAFFNSQKTLLRQAFYSVPQSLPTPNVYFTPPFTKIYYEPVLVMLKGYKKNDTILVFRNKELRGFTYEGPFWLNVSTNLTAVLNEKNIVKAFYNIQATGTPVEVYPVSGKYIGGVSCFVYQSNPQANYTISINNSIWKPLKNSVFILDSVGNNSVAVRAIYLGGVVSITWRTYEIIESTLPLLNPSPDVIYTHSIRVTCNDPMGRSLAVDFSEEEEPIYSVRFGTPGSFSVNCTYIDNLHQIRTSTAVYKLHSVPLPMPLLLPDCGRAFPMIPILLNVTIFPPFESDNDEDLSRITLNATATKAILKKLSSGNLFSLEPTQQPALMNATVTLITSSSHPLEGDSLPNVCNYEFFPLGSSSTPSFIGRPTCKDMVKCIDTIKQEVSTCLSFYSTDLIHTLMVGDFVLIKLVRLPYSLQMEYYNRTKNCLLEASLQDVMDEASGLIQLARWWEVNTSSLSNLVTGVRISILVDGWNLDMVHLHLVRMEYTCEDIGIHEVDRNNTGPYSLVLFFVIDTPGEYKLCASVDDTLYTVPSNGPLVVNPVPFPQLVSTPCGGRSEVGAVSVVADVIPRVVYPHIFFSIDSGIWYETVAGALLRIAYLTTTKSSAVVSLTAGKFSGSSTTCVFYTSSVDASVKLSYKWAVVSRYEEQSNIIFVVNGTFSEDVRIEFRVYLPKQNKTNTFSLTTSNVVSSYDFLNDEPIFTSLGTTMDSFAVIDQLFHFVTSEEEYPLSIVVTVDGISVNADPLLIALSPLAAAMYSCNNCTSGWCFRDRCVCIGEVNHTAHFCTDVPKPPVSPSSGTSHFLFLCAFLLLVGGCILFIVIIVRRGTARKGKIQGTDITIEAP